MLFKNITIIDENYEAQEHMNLLTDGKKITYIGKDMPAGYEGEIYDGSNKVAMPGFFNIHCHVPMTLIRGYGEGLPLHRWLHERMFPFEALLTPEDMYWGGLLGMAEMIASGAVSFTDMYMEMDGISKAVEESGMKANLSHGCSAFSDDVHFTDVNGYKGIHYLMDYVKNANHDRIIGDTSLHAEYTSTETLVHEIAQFAKENHLNMHTHISETQKEHEECKQRRGGLTPVQFFNKCGVFDVPTTAAHCVWIEGEDFDIMKEKGVTACHCPSSNLKLGSGIAPVKKMLEKGIRVGIGTDGAASNNNLNSLEEVNLASILQKGANNDPLFLGPQQLLELACRNGALSQGRADCGSIKVGNRADIVVYDLDKPHLQPVFDVLSNIMYSAQSGDICLSMIDGNVVYKNGVFTGIDLEKVLFHVNRIKDEKLAQLK
ncbi:amidohydrolase [Hydrogenoanaerobacterium sp.]|uniref:amidohydrolase family protein n=1 Tax=Hydrogenoanaerobacterium sp. TaxID=2953763 RepID=UPI0028A10BB7|nr:amidohydrolase [Hydrogenoanaerobacterium sp.]